MEAGVDGNEILHNVMVSRLLGDFIWAKSPLTKALPISDARIFPPLPRVRLRVFEASDRQPLRLRPYREGESFSDLTKRTVERSPRSLFVWRDRENEKTVASGKKGIVFPVLLWYTEHGNK